LRCALRSFWFSNLLHIEAFIVKVCAMNLRKFMNVMIALKIFEILFRSKQNRLLTFLSKRSVAAINGCKGNYIAYGCLKKLPGEEAFEYLHYTIK
jgi:hypothetical protein